MTAIYKPLGSGEYIRLRCAPGRHAFHITVLYVNVRVINKISGEDKVVPQ